jgi:hypothetical protein
MDAASYPTNEIGDPGRRLPRAIPMEVLMVYGVISGGAIVGTKTTAAVLGGGISVLLGFVGFTLLLLAAARQPSSPRRRIGHPFFALGSALFVVIGGAVLFGGILAPIKRIARLEQKQTADSTEFLKRIAKMQADLKRIARMQSEQVTRALLSEPRRQDSKRLNQHEYRVSSQNGEDGIIAEIFRRIGTTNRTFVEFGASDGSENNTALLVRQGWSGLWMDADTQAIARAKETFHPEIASGKLVVLEAFIYAENIEDLFHQGKVPAEFDLLSIDIDRNDYYVWEKITHYRPRVVVIEYNAVAPPTMCWKVPYDPKAFGWNGFGNGNGASLKALEELGATKGYRLVGCDLCGVNAFFVREDLLGDQFAAPYTAENHYEPFRAIYFLEVYPASRCP